MQDVAFLMIRNITTASSIRVAVNKMLRERKIVNTKLKLDVIYDVMPGTDRLKYGFNLRVWSNPYSGVRGQGKEVLSLWGETREELLSEVNMLTLLLIYNG